ncbi:5-bromo-4-chloroindolyl phosphate hydrolase [Marichromatium purpuratum 984]|uniref:5-bromo-4-chloroindolyl phosphate hydrolase n=1 Tax=Marichromatium purpuratum 984 TaxID=765910 RepID=W0DZ39_MARPU|nr:5-bromo-4-chloroindolyl phosphate hydrolysis family protein [Marichromatium purpuratum]AHF03692.1 5-bromo-4-chloroindolyl phosphate hydrolase [Marichromatium purpuratum 984]
MVSSGAGRLGELLREGVVARETPRAPRLRGLLLFVLPLPLLFGALIALGAGRLESFLADASGFALFMAAAYLTRRGIREAHLQDRRRRFARLPRVRLQTLGGLLVALATGWCVLVSLGQGAGLALAFAAVALLGFHLSYGLMPEAPEQPFDFSDARARKVAAALAEAEQKLIEVETAAARIANPELKARLGRIALKGRRILEQIAERPTDLFRARKFLNVYLDGVRQVTDGYARTHRQADVLALEENFRGVLVTVEEVFDEQHQRLLDSDLMDLDVRIEVLKQQLEREGLS